MSSKLSLLYGLLLTLSALAQRPTYDPTLDVLSDRNVTRKTKRIEKREKTGDIWVDYHNKGVAFYKAWMDKTPPDTFFPGIVPDEFDVLIRPATRFLVAPETMQLIKDLGKPGNIDDYSSFHLQWPREDCAGEVDMSNGDSEGNDPNDHEMSEDNFSESSEPNDDWWVDGESAAGSGPGTPYDNDMDPATFACIISAKEGVFIASSISRGVDMPKDWKFSQLVWWMWATAVQAQHPHSDPQYLDYTGLDHYFQSIVNNQDTTQLLEIALRGVNPPGTWYFKPDSPLNLAEAEVSNPYWSLLACPNLVGLISLLTEHKLGFDGKGVGRIAVFWSDQGIWRNMYEPGSDSPLLGNPKPQYIPNLPDTKAPLPGRPEMNLKTIMWADLTQGFE